MMRNILLSTTAVLSLGLATAAAAQETQAADSPPTTAPTETAGAVTDAAAADAADQGGLQDIVVTAQRRSENLQRAAVAVSAVSGDALISAGISETTALTRLVPSLQVTPTGGSGSGFYLRGVGTLQGNAFGENPIAFNFNGVYIARPTAPVGAFFDLERVEVVKGPQGTLYGRNATGGAINVLPKRPRIGEFGGDVMLEYGNYDSKKVSGAINIPIGQDGAIRVAGQIVDRDGYLSDGYQDEQGEAMRVSLMFKPSPDLSFTLVGDYFHQGGRGVGSVLSPGAAFGNPSGFAYPGYVAPPLSARIGGADPRSIAALAASPPPAAAFLANGFVAPPQRNGFIDSDFYGLSATLEGDLGFGTLTVLPAYRRSEPNFRTYNPGFLGEVQEKDDQYSLEVRLASNSDQALRYVAGAFYFKEEQDASNRFNQRIIADTHFQPRLETESKAAFAQFTLDLSETFRLVAGGRYTQEDKSLVGTVQNSGPAGRGPLLTVQSDLDFSKFTWKAGVEADLGPQSLLFANVSTGFKAGGFFVGSADNTFAPEELTAYTIGSKNRFLDNRLQFNVEAFYWKYKDQQVSFVGPVRLGANIGSGGKVVNAGNARFYGFEAEMQFALTPKGIFSGNLLYNNTNYSSLSYEAISAGGTPLRNGCAVSAGGAAAPPARLFVVNCAGQPGLNAPKWSGSVAYEHTIELGGDLDLVLGARSRLSSGYFVSLEYLPELREGGYMQSDLSVTLQGPDDRWSLTGFVNNIEDETIIVGGFARPVLQTVYVTLAPPRTYGLRAGFKF